MNTNDNEKKEGYRYPIAEQATIIEKTLDSYGIRVRVAEINYLPNDAIQYCLEIVVGTKIEDIEKRKKELAQALSSSTGTIEIQAPIPGRALIGITVPKVKKIKEEQKTDEKQKTILGKGVNFLANIFGVISEILSYAVDAFESRKDIAGQLLIIIIVPIVITALSEKKFYVLKALEYFIVSFIIWLLVLGIQQNGNEKNGRS